MKKILGVLLFVTLTVSVFADEVKKEPIKLTIEKSVEMALENNLTLKMDIIDKKAAQRRMGTFWNKYIPSVSAKMGMIYSDNLFSDPAPADLSGTPFAGMESLLFPEAEPWTFTMGVDITLPINMESFTNIAKTKHNYDAGKMTYEQAEKQMILNVKKAFYGLIAAQASRELREKNLQMMEKQYAQALANYRSGLLPEVELLKAQVGLETMKPELTKMINNYQNQEMLFKMLLGIDKETPIEIEGDLSIVMEEYNSEYILSHFMGNRLDAQILSASIKELKATELGTWGLKRTPTLVTSMTWSSNVNDPGDSEKWERDNWRDSFGISFILSVPIDGWIPGTVTDVQLKEIRDKIKKLELKLEMTYENGSIEVTRLVNNLNASRDVAEALKLNVTLAQRTYWLTSQSYNAGTQQYLDVENAQTALFEAESKVLLENYNYISTLLDLEFALNTEAKDLLKKNETKSTNNKETTEKEKVEE